jgi:hypothetical protein
MKFHLVHLANLWKNAKNRSPSGSDNVFVEVAQVLKTSYYDVMGSSVHSLIHSAFVYPSLFVHNKWLKLLWEIPYTLRQELSSSRINIRGDSGSLSRTEGSLHSVKMCCHANNPIIHNRPSSHSQLNPQAHSVGRDCCTKYRPVSAFLHAPLGLRGNAGMDVQSSTSILQKT